MAPGGGCRFTPVELLGCPSASAPKAWVGQGIGGCQTGAIYSLEPPIRLGGYIVEVGLA